MSGEVVDDDKSFKICSVLGGLDITRLVSSNTRSFFGSAIEDVEQVREFVSTAATHQGIVGGLSDFEEISRTLDWQARGFDSPTTSVEAGLGIVDDRIERTMERFVSYANEPLVGDKQTDMKIINSVSLVFPWIVDRKSNEANWWVKHQNGRSEGQSKEPFLFEALYTAAWIGTYGEVWAYYPPLHVFGHPFTFSDIFPTTYDSHEEEFVKPNLEENNPDRNAFFTAPYPDSAVPGLSLITAMAPIYFTGTFGNYTFNDTYLASTGLDIAVSSVSTLLHVLENKLTKSSFGILVDSNFNTIVVSQPVVELVYPQRTGFEESRVTYDFNDGSIVDDRRNQTYLVSDTILQPLTDLNNADWSSLLASVQAVQPGGRSFDTISMTLTGETNTTDYYVMFERWQFVADWALLVFAPVEEVESAVDVRIHGDDSQESRIISLEGTKGSEVGGTAHITNTGTLDVVVSPNTVPRWIDLVTNTTTIEAGETLPIAFNVLTDELEIGSSSGVMTFNIQDDQYPDCFYNEDLSIEVSMYLPAQDCGANRVPDSNGMCVCASQTVALGGNCLSLGIFLAGIFAPVVLLLLVGVIWYNMRSRRMVDSVWKVKPDEVIYAEPPEVLGRGTFGLVLLGTYRGTPVAVKRVLPPKSEGVLPSKRSTVDSSTNFDEDMESGEGGAMSSGHSTLKSSTGIMASRFFGKKDSHSKLREDFVKEMRYLSKLRHPCITMVMGAVIEHGQDPLLVMEHMDHGSLYDVLHNESFPLEGDMILPILRDIAQGILFLHAADPQVIHSDLKAQNILIDSKFRAKVADFGLSAKKQVGIAGTPLWMAPELLRGESVNTAASDIYALGVILYEVYSRKDPYHEFRNLEKVLMEVANPSINRRPAVPPACPSVVRVIMKECWNAEPANRPTAAEIDTRLKRLDVDMAEPCAKMKRRISIVDPEKKEDVLFNLFPKHIAEALRDGRKVEPERREMVTIFFASIHGFDDVVADSSPEKISDLLDRLYDRFDQLAEKHDVFKIETVGDAYMCASNLVKIQDEDHVKRIAQFSIDAIRAASETSIDVDDPSLGNVQIRVGFHSGPVISNLVGTCRPKFGVFGDTVNTANKMEAASKPGRIRCSDFAARLLRKQDQEIKIFSRIDLCPENVGVGDTNVNWIWIDGAGHREQTVNKRRASGGTDDGIDPSPSPSASANSADPTKIIPLTGSPMSSLQPAPTKRWVSRGEDAGIASRPTSRAAAPEEKPSLDLAARLAATAGCTDRRGI